MAELDDTLEAQEERIRALAELAKQQMVLPPKSSDAFKGIPGEERLQLLIEGLRGQTGITGKQVPIKWQDPGMSQYVPGRKAAGAYKPSTREIVIDPSLGSARADVAAHELLHAKEDIRGDKRQTLKGHFKGQKKDQTRYQHLSDVIKSWKKETDFPYEERLEQLTGLRDTEEAEKLLWPKVKK